MALCVTRQFGISRHLTLNQAPLMILIVLAILAGGFIAGISLRRRERARQWADGGLTASIYFFLFVLGMMTGADRETLMQLPRLGLQAALIAIAGVAGSIAAALLLSHFALKDADLEE